MSNPFVRLCETSPERARQLLETHSSEEAETVALLIEATERFAKAHLDDAQIDAQKRIPDETLAAAAELGLFGLTIPGELGGAGLSLKGMCRVMDTLSQFDRSMAATVGAHNGLGLRGLLHYGLPALKQQLVPQLASGKALACFAATESEAGSDIASMRTAVRVDGDSLVLNGSKAYITNGRLAKVATVLARAADFARGHAMLLVPLDLPGVRRGPEENKLGLRGSSTCSLYFDDVRVPKENLLGSPSAGLTQMSHVLSWGRLVMSSACVGIGRAALKRSVAQVTHRIQFRRPIAEFGMVREKIALMRGAIHAMESVILLVAGLEDERSSSAEWESACAKMLCSEKVWEIVDHAVQLHGGSGFIEDTGVARLLRDARIFRIFEGANEILRLRLASEAFQWQRGTCDPVALLGSSVASEFAAVLKEYSALFNRCFDKLTQLESVHGLGVLKRQLILKRLADALAGLYMLAAVLLRAESAAGRNALSSALVALTQVSAEQLLIGVQASLDALERGASSDGWYSAVAQHECEQAGYALKDPF